MVSKQCAACGEYFVGEMNGDYVCPACQQAGTQPRARPLANLDGLSGAGRTAAGDPPSDRAA